MRVKKVIVEKAEPMQRIAATYPDVLERLAARKKSGPEILNVGRIVPDLPLHPEVEKIAQQYFKESLIWSPKPDAKLVAEFKKLAAEYIEERTGQKLDRFSALAPIPGVKQGFFHLFLLYLEAREKVFLPDPAFPFFRQAVFSAKGEAVPYPLHARTDYLPNFEALDALRGGSPKVLVLNYPHSPTGAAADRNFFEQAVEWASRKNVLLASDFTYGELYYDQTPSVPLLSVPKAAKAAVEFFSFTHTFNLPAPKLGLAVGKREVVENLESYVLSLGIYPSNFALRLGIELLKRRREIISYHNQILAERKKIVVDGLARLGWNFWRPKGGCFVWVEIPTRAGSLSFARKLLRKTGVLVYPGNYFGEAGEGHFRLSLAVPTETITSVLVHLQAVFASGRRKFRLFEKREKQSA
ncbi:MAG: aminotransferase class I/II-fold pyridoxal phosphate-dependent enzyme [candidate division Zixibacteria bacterium]|nr:aminotransferase class I/II-fold pyridoxal phosphate-dependent enzyme [candidate division Zixibacteria bacterium]MCI0597153.1 aminotransferase class I/II-fold pyridoxal phosphate-dependent enzyme [candidate division Zixibacteria bacterium]